MDAVIFLLLVTTVFENAKAAPDLSDRDRRKIEREFSKSLDTLNGPRPCIACLHSASQAASVVYSFSMLASSINDVSLNNEKTKNLINMLANPNSLCASLYQTAASISDSLRTAEVSMLSIHESLLGVNGDLAQIVTFFAHPDDASTNIRIRIKLNTYNRRIKNCREAIDDVTNSFIYTRNLITELVQAIMTINGENEQKLNHINDVLNAIKRETDNQSFMQQRLHADILSKQEKITKAMENHGKINVAELEEMCSEPYKCAMASADQLQPMDQNVENMIMRYETNWQSTYELARQIAKYKREQLNANDVVDSLKSGAETLGKMQVEWGRLRAFFNAMSDYITSTNSTSYINMKRPKDESEILKKFVFEKIEASFNLIVWCGKLALSSDIYLQNSKIYVIPILDDSIALYAKARRKDEVRVELQNMVPKLEERRKRSASFVEEKLDDAKKRTNRELRDYRDIFMDVLKL